MYTLLPYLLLYSKRCHIRSGIIQCICMWHHLVILTWLPSSYILHKVSKPRQAVLRCQARCLQLPLGCVYVTRKHQLPEQLSLGRADVANRMTLVSSQDRN